MMLLAVDVGNTNTVFGLFADGAAIGQWRFSTNRERTSDEYAAMLVQLMHLAGHRRRDIEAIIVSSVVPQANFPLRRMSRDSFGLEAFFCGEDLDYPMEIALENPKEIGADRIVNAIAARERYQGALIIVDFGTATTFDLVSAAGVYQGGAIAPGINLSLEALHRAAARLPRIAVERPNAIIGSSTVEAMQSGVFWGYVSLIDGLVEKMSKAWPERITTVATGGLAPLFASSAETLQHVDPDLTMVGLLSMYEREKERILAAKAAPAAG